MYSAGSMGFIDAARDICTGLEAHYGDDATISVEYAKIAVREKFDGTDSINGTVIAQCERAYQSRVLLRVTIGGDKFDFTLSHTVRDLPVVAHYCGADHRDRVRDKRRNIGKDMAPVVEWIIERVTSSQDRMSRNREISETMAGLSAVLSEHTSCAHQVSDKEVGFRFDSEGCDLSPEVKIILTPGWGESPYQMKVEFSRFTANTLPALEALKDRGLVLLIGRNKISASAQAKASFIAAVINCVHSYFPEVSENQEAAA